MCFVTTKYTILKLFQIDSNLMNISCKHSAFLVRAQILLYSIKNSNRIRFVAHIKSRDRLWILSDRRWFESEKKERTRKREAKKLHKWKNKKKKNTHTNENNKSKFIKIHSQ